MRRGTQRYDLAAVDQWIAARGSMDTMLSLRRWPNAQLRTSADGPYVLLPSSRQAFLAVEAMCAVSSLSPSYLQVRRRFFEPAIADLLAVDAALDLPTPLDRELLPHQQEFLAFARNRAHVFNASEQGTGKTTMTWTLLHLWQSQRALIVLPAGLSSQWEAELSELWGGELYAPWATLSLDSGDLDLKQRAAMLRTYCQDLSHPVAVFVNYEVLEALRPQLERYLNPDTLVCDESWRLKCPKAKCTQAAISLAEDAGHCMMLAGTPVGQHAADLWTQLLMLRAEGGYTYASFCQRFCKMEPVRIAGRMTTRPRGLTDPVGLMQLLEPVWFRATKATCLRLPPQRDEVIRLSLPPDTARLYNDVAEDGESALGAEGSLAGEQVVDLRLQQLAGGHKPVPTGFGAAATWDLEPILPCPKLEWVMRFFNERLAHDPTRRAIVWTHFKHEADRIGRMLNEVIATEVIHGGKSCRPSWLAEVKDSFNSRAEDGVRVIVATVDKLAYGHNLQAADYHVYFSMPWASIPHLQSRDRSHRLGRDDVVSYFYLVAEGTIDEDVYRNLQMHRGLHERVGVHTIGGEATTGSGPNQSGY